MNKNIFSVMMMLMLVGTAFGACTVVNSPTSLNADCNTGALTWTLTGCPADMNGTLTVGGTNMTVQSCSVGTDAGSTFTATGAGSATCITTVSTSQAIGATTHAVVDDDGGVGGVSNAFSYSYCAVYSSDDMGEAVGDTITGLFAGVSSLAETYGIVIIALAVVGILFGILILLKKR